MALSNSTCASPFSLNDIATAFLLNFYIVCQVDTEAQETKWSCFWDQQRGLLVRHD